MKTPGQICYKAGTSSLNWVRKIAHRCWESLPEDEWTAWEAAAQAVLASQWRPVSEIPVDISEPFVFAGGGYSFPICKWGTQSNRRTHYMPLPPLPAPPEPTPEERERAEFEAHPEFSKWDRTLTPEGRYDKTQTHFAWRGWQAARATKEGAMP